MVHKIQKLKKDHIVRKLNYLDQAQVPQRPLGSDLYQTRPYILIPLTRQWSLVKYAQKYHDFHNVQSSWWLHFFCGVVGILYRI